MGMKSRSIVLWCLGGLLSLLVSIFSFYAQAADVPALLEVETALRESLSQYPADTDYTLGLETPTGRLFVHQQGESTPFDYYEAASSAKMVTSFIIMYYVDRGLLTLDDHPQRFINTWPTTGKLSRITLAHLLSFTSGLKNEPACINSPTADFAQCVDEIATLNAAASSPGTTFFYRSAHMQVAGLMLINALQVASWQDVFKAFKQNTGLFASSFYDYPSANNPMLAIGMRWTGYDYMQFLRAVARDQLFSKSFMPYLFSYMDTFLKSNWIYGHITDDWYYGFGFWVECTIKPSTDCGDIKRISSVGVYGAYPFIDFEHGYYGIVAREGAYGTDVNAYDLMNAHNELIEQWAALAK